MLAINSDNSKYECHRDLKKPFKPMTYIYFALFQAQDTMSLV